MLNDVDTQVREMYLSGIGLPGISRAIGRSQCFVSGRLKKTGVALRRPGNPDKIRPYRSASPDLLEMAVARYIAGESAKAISSNSGISKPHLLKILRARAIHIRLQAAGSDEEIVSAYISGSSLKMIEVSIGCTKRRASNVLKKFGVELRIRTREKTSTSRAAACKRRSDRVAQATPPWADRDAIKAIYAECRRVSKETGKKHHVDHVFPLCGDEVCGLHVPENLVITTERENIAKKNKVDPKHLEFTHVN